MGVKLVSVTEKDLSDYTICCFCWGDTLVLSSTCRCIPWYFSLSVFNKNKLKKSDEKGQTSRS